MEVQELLKSHNYRLFTEIDNQQQEKIKGLLSGANLDNQNVYVKVYSAVVDTKDNENQTLWTTRIIFASFFFIDSENKLSDNFFVPVRPFRIRTTYESYEMNQLADKILKESNEIANNIIGENVDLENDILSNIGRA